VKLAHLLYLAQTHACVDVPSYALHMGSACLNALLSSDTWMARAVNAASLLNNQLLQLGRQLMCTPEVSIACRPRKSSLPDHAMVCWAEAKRMLWHPCQ